jgi:1,2-diacylglycerol 3-beta-galactosyltransferase
MIGMLRSLPPQAVAPGSPAGAPGEAPRAPTPLLFLVADTGGGHRSAAQAVADALGRAYPGRFAPVLLDPLTGPRAPWPLRRVTRLYGPLIRWAPRAWGAVYRLTDSRPAVRALAGTALRLAERPVAEAATALRPAAVVSFHPLATPAALAAQAALAAPGPERQVPVVTVVTDLVSAHAAWRYGPVDRIVTPSSLVARRCRLDGIGTDRCLDLGLPVGPQFGSGALAAGERDRLRRVLGLGERSFVVLVTGGGEGAGGLARRVPALLRAFRAGADGRMGPAEGSGGVEVVALCGRNRRLQRRLARLARRVGPGQSGHPRRPGPADGVRLTVRGFVGNMAEWLRCADVVVTKAGPGTIAEAACCGTPLIITSRLPGQEDGNAEFVVAAGAGRYAPRPADVAREAGRLRREPATLDAMRAASARLGRPEAAASVAALLARLTGPPGATDPAGPRGAARAAATAPGRPSTTQVTRPNRTDVPEVPHARV